MTREQALMELAANTARRGQGVQGPALLQDLTGGFFVVDSVSRAITSEGTWEWGSPRFEQQDVFLRRTRFATAEEAIENYLRVAVRS